MLKHDVNQFTFENGPALAVPQSSCFNNTTHPAGASRGLLKRCAGCKSEKAITEFYKQTKNGNPFGFCKKCQLVKMKKRRNDNPDIVKRESELRRKRRLASPKQLFNWQLKHTYGISIAAYELLIKAQGATCAICGKAATNKYKRLHVDHNHTTGEIRGLLCHGCNVAIGMVKENPTTLRAAADYLESFAGRRAILSIGGKR